MSIRSLRPLTALFLLLGLSHCSDGGGLPEPSFQVISEGTGPANAAPLDPLITGERHMDPKSKSVITVGAPVEIGGRTLIPVEDASARKTSYLAPSSAGVAFHGSSSEPLLEAPIVIAPSTVRLGMKWSAPGTPYSFEVTAREETDTPVGPGVVWTIEQTGGDAKVTRVYGEGLGLLGLDQTKFSALFLPRAASSAQSSAKLTLTPITKGGAQITWGNLEPLSISAVDGGDGALTIGISGLQQVWDSANQRWAPSLVPVCTAFKADDFSDVTPIGNADADHLKGMWSSAPTCMVDNSNVYLPTLASDASAVSFVGDRTYNLRRGFSGEVVSPHFGGGAHQILLSTWTSGDAPEVLYGGDFGDILQWSLARWGDPDSASTRIGDYGNPFLNMSLFQQFTGGFSPAGMHAIAAPSREPGARVPVALVSNTGVVARFEVDEEGPTVTVGQFAASSRSTTRGAPDARDVLFTSYEGAIDRLVFGAPDFSLTRLGVVGVPAGSKLVGAMQIPGSQDLLVFTHQASHAESEAGTTSAWRATPQPQPFTPAPALGVGAAVSGLDVVVCWPKTSAPLDPTGWTLGGAAPIAVLPTADASADANRCAIVVRDITKPFDPAKPGAYATEGPIPGVGAMLIAPPTEAARDPYGFYSALVTAAPFAALKGGGLVNYAHRFTPGGFAIEDVGRPAAAVQGFPDAAGNGLWSYDFPQSRWKLQGLDAHMANIPVPTLALQTRLVGLAQGGGALVGVPPVDGAAPKNIYYVAPDGSATLVQPHKLDLAVTGPTGLPEWAGRLEVGRLADGSICGSEFLGGPAPFEFVCYDAGGVRRALNVSDRMPQTGSWELHWVLLSDGSFAFSQDEMGAWRFDPVAMTFTQLDPRPFLHPNYASDGSMWAILYEGSPEVPTATTPVLVSPAGFSEITSLPDPKPLFGSDKNIVGVIPDEGSVVVLVGQGYQGEPLAYYRWPKPAM